MEVTMLYEKFAKEAEKKESSGKEREKRMKELFQFVKAQSHLYDDHGAVIIGHRSDPPHFDPFEIE